MKAVEYSVRSPLHSVLAVLSLASSRMSTGIVQLTTLLSISLAIIIAWCVSLTHSLELSAACWRAHRLEIDMETEHGDRLRVVKDSSV